MFTRGSRGKLVVRITDIFKNYHGDDFVSVPVTNITAAEVVRLVLEKCKRKEEPFCYQLCILCYDKSRNRILADSECPQAIKSLWKSTGKQQNYFQLCNRKSGLLKIFYRDEGKSGTETFHSVIVTPSTNCRQLLQMVTEKLHFPQEQYALVERRIGSEEEREVGTRELPLITQLKWKPQSAYRFELHKIQHQLKEVQQNVAVIVEDTLINSQSMNPTMTRCASTNPNQPLASTENDETPINYGQSLQLNFNHNNNSYVSHPAIQYSDQECKSQLMDRAELMAYLKSLFTGSAGTASPTTREEVLENALKEQNAVIDLLQQLNASLEKRNEMLEAKVTEQSREVLEAEGHMLAAEQALASSKVTKDDQGSISFAAVTGMEKILAQKDSIIASLQASLASKGGTSESSGGVTLGMQLSHLRSRVEQERLHSIELEEELAEKREEITNLNHLLSGEKSRLIKSQSQANFLNHELESAKKLNKQQKQLVFDLRASLNDKNLQLNKLIGTLVDECKQVALSTKNKSIQTDELVDSPTSSPNVIQKNLSHLAMGLAPKVHAPMYEQLAGRQVITCELERRQDNPELGFSYSTLDIPVSSISGSCLVIRAVKDGSVASQFLKPGDEILEVNSFPCRSFFQGQAIDSLQQKSGNLKLVIARELSSRGSEMGLYASTSRTSFGATSVDVKLHSTEDDSEYSSRPPSMVWLTAEDDTDTNSSYSGPLYTDSSLAKSPSMMSPRPSQAVTASFSKSPSSETFSTASLLDDPISAELEKLKVGLQQKDEVINKLSATLKNHETTIKHLSTDVNELQLKLDDSDTIKDSLQNELCSVNSCLTKAKLELAQEKEVTRKQVQQLEELQNKVEEMRSSQSGMSDIVEAKERDILLVKADNKLVKEELHTLQQMHDSYKTEAQKLITDETMQKDEMEKHMSEARIKSEELILKVTSLSKDLVDAKINMEQKESDFYERLKKLVTENQHLRTDIASMQETSTKSSTTLQNTCDKLEELNKEISAKNALLSEKNQLCDTVTKEKNQLEETLTITAAQLNQVQESKEEIMQENEILKKAQGQWRIEQSELLETCSSRDKQITQLMQSEVQNSSQLEEAKTRISTLHGEMRQFQNTVENCAIEKARLEMQIIQYKDQLLTLESANEINTGELKILNDKLNSTTEQLNTANTALVQLQAKNKTLDDREKKLNKQLEKLTSEQKSSEMKFSMKIRSLEAQKAVIEKELERQNSLHQQGVNDEVTRLCNEAAQQREILMNNESERIKLLTEIEQGKKGQQRMEKEIEALKSSQEALEATNSLLKTKHAEINDMLSQSTGNCETLQNKLTAHETTNTELQTSNTKLHDRVKELEGECFEMQEMLQKHEQKIFDDQVLLGNISQQLETAQLEVNIKTAKSSKLEEEMISEKNKLKQCESSNKLLQEEVEKLTKLKHQLNEKIAMSEAMLDQEKNKVKHLKNAVTSKSTEYTAIEETWTAFKKDSTLKIQALTTQNVALEENIEVLKKQLDKQNSENSLITSELTGKLEEKAAALKMSQEEVAAITVDNLEKHNNIVRLQGELMQAEKITSQLKESLNIIEIKLANYQNLEKETSGQLKQLQQDHSMLLSINAELKHKVDKSESELIGSKVVAKSLSNSLQEMKSNMLAMDERCHILEKQKNELQKECHIHDASSKALENSNHSLKGELEAYQTANDQMKTSIAEMRSDIEKLSNDQILKANLEKEEALKTKIDQLETAKKELVATNEALQTCQDEMKELLLKAEHDKENKAEIHAQQVLSLQQKLRQKEKTEIELTRKLTNTERSKQELQSTVDQLIAAQTALNDTLTSSGTVKEMEIAKLQAKIVDLEKSLSSTKMELNESKEAEAKLKHNISQIERERQAHSVSADKLQASVDKLNEDYEKESKSQLEKIKSLQLTNNELENENQKLKFESSGLNEEISKLANLKLLLVEKEEENTLVNKELKENLAMVSALTVERDHLITTLRRYEVNKHTESVQQPTPKAARASSKEDLIKLLKDKEEEAFRLKDYISKLLASVVERAPFILEQMK